MSITLYDSYTRSLRPFEPINAGQVGMYCCGPTVYDFAHIGNLRTYIFEDLLRRMFEFNGYQVNHVMNITDVGHLVSDADDGEDKMEKGARRTGKTAWQIAEEYTQAFMSDMTHLNIQQPSTWCKATDHIQEQIEFIEDIEAKGFTYQTSDGVYFDTSKLDDYGYMARLNRDGLDAGHRVELGEKKQITDFALWKFSTGGQQRQMEWPSPWGVGFPGWHIECSAMSQKYLGDLFDIHCGGEDHIPIHHTNEIAQTQARCGTRLANFWIHGYFLVVNKEKVSKSSGDGFLRVQLLLDQGYDPLVYRFLCLTAHYRSHLNFSWDALDAAKTTLNRLRTQYYELPEDASPADTTFLERFQAEINQDLNLPKALTLVWEILKSDLAPGCKKATLTRMDSVLGLQLATWEPKVEAIPETVTQLAEARLQARKDKNWAEADRLRDEILGHGYEMKDTREGYDIVKRD